MTHFSCFGEFQILTLIVGHFVTKRPFGSLRRASGKLAVHYFGESSTAGFSKMPVLWIPLGTEAVIRPIL
jgi:hypothetical protein